MKAMAMLGGLGVLALLLMGSSALTEKGAWASAWQPELTPQARSEATSWMLSLSAGPAPVASAVDSVAERDVGFGVSGARGWRSNLLSLESGVQVGSADSALEVSTVSKQQRTHKGTPAPGGRAAPVVLRASEADRGCGDPLAGDCCEANGTPYCDNAECCDSVCMQEGFEYCCASAALGWDLFCAMAAQEDPNCNCGGGGGGCGDPMAGDCCEANGTPYCNNAECCDSVCMQEGFDYCCAPEGEGWDMFCAMAAQENPNCECGGGGGCGDPMAGDCCEANGTPYCNNAECCDSVCMQEGFDYCCAPEGEGWDMFCAMAAQENPNCNCGGGGGCGDPRAGDCCEANFTPYCDNLECCEAVCMQEGFEYCCDPEGEGWDMFCAMAAQENPNCECGGGGGCGDPEAGDCCEANDTPYCDNAECCDAICAIMPYCCQEGGEGWDMFCAAAAQENPNCPCGPTAGACCDPFTGDCTDEVPYDECQPPLQYTPGGVCDFLEPTCGNPGACCDDWGGEGTCTEGVLEALCEGSRFLPGGSCEDFEPPCGELTPIDIVFLENPTDPPPDSLCECLTTSFPADPRPIWDEVTSVASPCAVGGEVLFSSMVFHHIVGESWNTWSHGYQGDVYLTQSDISELTLALPPGTCSFYFYVEPYYQAVFHLQVTVNGVYSSEPFPVNGDGGAAYVGVCAENIETITVVCLEGYPFAVGEFGICCSCPPVYGACCDPYEGDCTDETVATDCFPPLVFNANKSCRDLHPPCGNPGACCDRFTGECEDNVPELACPKGSRFEAGMECDALDPPCGTPGCCCLDSEEMLWVEYEAACLDLGGRFVPAIEAEECAAELFDPPCGEWESTGILYAPTHEDSVAWRETLSQLCSARVDYWDARAGTPTLEYLRNYRAVFTYVQYPYADGVAMGNVLADYVDAGGKVIMGQWTYPSALGEEYCLGGRIIDPDYCPVTVDDYYAGLEYAYDGTDCVWCNVGVFDGLFYDKCTPVDGAVTDGTLVGNDMEYPALIWRADRRVYYSPGNTGPNCMPGDTAQMIANMYACTGSVAVGACCDPYTGDCTDELECGSCSEGSVLHVGTTCEALEPVCGNPGCCCDEVTGDTVIAYEEECAGRFLPGLTAGECTAEAFDPPCGTYETCTHSLTMWDDWGDGWNGGFLDVYVNGFLVLPSVTLAEGSGPETVYFDAGTYDEITAAWTAGAFQVEISYCIYDAFGVALGCDGLGHTEPTGITVSGACDEPVCGDGVCAPPENVCTCPADCGNYSCLNQPPNHLNAVGADLHCPGFSETGMQIVADNFIVCAEDVREIDGVRFWGIYFPLAPTDPDEFTVVFRSDGAHELPGAVIAAYGPQPATTKETTGVMVYDAEEFEYTIDLEPNLILEGGTYWIEIYNNTPQSPEGGWGWVTGAPDDGTGIFSAVMTQEVPEVWTAVWPASDLALEIICAAAPFEIEEWRSWKEHGGEAGRLGITLNHEAAWCPELDENVAVEPRWDGVSEVTVRFTEPIMLPDAFNITVTGLASAPEPYGPESPSGVSLSEDGTVLHLWFDEMPAPPAGPDVYTITLNEITSAAGQPLEGDADCEVIVQYGNVHNLGASKGSADATDFNRILAASTGRELVTEENCKFDVYSAGASAGVVDALDANHELAAFSTLWPCDAGGDGQPLPSMTSGTVKPTVSRTSP